MITNVLPDNRLDILFCSDGFSNLNSFDSSKISEQCLLKYLSIESIRESPTPEIFLKQLAPVSVIFLINSSKSYLQYFAISLLADLPNNGIERLYKNRSRFVLRDFSIESSSLSTDRLPNPGSVFILRE